MELERERERDRQTERETIESKNQKSRHKNNLIKFANKVSGFFIAFGVGP